MIFANYIINNLKFVEAVRSSNNNSISFEITYYRRLSCFTYNLHFIDDESLSSNNYETKWKIREFSYFKNRCSERSGNVERWSTNFFADLDSVELFVLPRLAVIPSAILGYGASSEDRRIVRSQVRIYDQLTVEHQPGSTDRWKNGSIEWWNATSPTLVNYSLTIDVKYWQSPKNIFMPIVFS